MQDETVEFIEQIESSMDSYNGENGTQEALCCFCGSKDYDGFSGIIHSKDCLIKIVRDWLLVNRD